MGKRGRNDASASQGRDEVCQHRVTGPVTLHGASAELANLVPTVASPHKDDGKLGQHDGFSDGNGHLLEDLNTRNNMFIVVPRSDNP